MRRSLRYILWFCPGLWILWLWGEPQLPDFARVRANWHASDGVLLDRHGAILHEMRVSFVGRRLAWTSLQEIAPAALAIIVRAEDQRFYSHHGVDVRALAASLWGRLTGKGRRGGSTISMQLAGLLNPEMTGRPGLRSLVGKWRQMRAAWKLESTWSKNAILEAYVNRVSFRGEWEGIGTATRGLFNKSVGGLTPAEGIILAALLRAPSATLPQVAQRACQLKNRLAADMSCATLQEEVANALTRNQWIEPLHAAAPQLARWLLPGEHGETIRTTIDGNLQHSVRDILADHLSHLKAQNVHHGAALVVNNAHGDVVAYVGNHPQAEALSQVDGIKALRQAGSTLKPFLYGLALEKRLLTAASLLEDAPLDLMTPGGGLYVPRNYEEDFKGWVSVRTALASSLNVPAVKTLLLAGLEPAVQRLRRLGFSAIVKDGLYYGPALALGSVEVSLWQLVNSYRTLANEGLYSPLRLIPDESPPARERVLPPEASFLITDILADPSARALTFGLDNPLNLPFWSAAKTGTSKGMRDNWCVGFTREWSVGVWVGNFSGESMHDVSGITGAAPVWHAIMTTLPSAHREPAPPRGLVKTRTVFAGNEEAERDEWYLTGTEMERVERAGNWQLRGRIVYPETGVILALDPDIPKSRERVFFRMEPQQPGYRWRLNGVEMDTENGWSPTPGHHRLELLNSRGETMDNTTFEVRGRSG
ncbi:MAG: penicillin-binding protein 1C [Magnetococcales bacterium]|nr:penicillin-binding protein 1C [Magnetococcales bacterium]